MNRRHRARSLLGSALLASLLALFQSSAAAGGLPFQAVDVLDLHYGINEVPDFMPDGRPATVVMTHRENGNAHGYDVYVVYALESRGRAGVPGVPELIDLLPETGISSDVIRNQPFDGEAEIDALRFVRGRSNGHAITALVEAHRKVGAVTRLTDAAPVELTVWQLDGPTPVAGRTVYAFRPASRSSTDRRYCNATSALHTEFGLAYPDGWDGEPTIDGCAPPATAAREDAGVEILKRLDVTSFDNSTGPRRRPGLRTLADYGFTQVQTFADGWSYASQADRSWTVGMLVLEDGPRRKLLCVTDSANGSGRYRSTAVVEAVPSADGLWRATGSTVFRSDCVGTRH